MEPIRPLPSTPLVEPADRARRIDRQDPEPDRRGDLDRRARRRSGRSSGEEPAAGEDLAAGAETGAGDPGATESWEPYDAAGAEPHDEAGRPRPHFSIDA